MSESNVNPSRSPSPEDLEVPLKRKRFDPSNLDTSSNNVETDWDPGCMQEEFQAFCSRLRKQTEKSFEIKRKQLEVQVQLGTETIAQLQEDLAREKSDKQQATVRLQEDLKRSKRETQEACRARAVAEEKLLQLITIMERQYNELTPLMISSSSDGIPTASQFQEKLQASAPVGKPSDTGSTSLDKSNPKNIRLKEARITIQTMTPEIMTHEQRKGLEARAKRADELEEELHVAKDTISSLHEASRKQESIMGERDQAGKLQEEGGTLRNDPSEGDEIGDSFQVEDSCSEASDETYSPSHDQSEDNDAQVLQQPLETVENDSAGEDDDGDSSLPASSDHTKADNLHEASREMDKPENLEKLMGILEREMGREDDDGDSSVSAADDYNAGTQSSHEHNSSSDDKSADDEESVMPQDEEQQHDDSRILIGDKYRFFVSGSQFLKIDWDEEYRRDDNSRWVCRRCSRSWKSRREVVDHVWINHYKGYFECPHCSDPPAHFSWRSSVTRHINSKHPQLTNV